MEPLRAFLEKHPRLYEGHAIPKDETELKALFEKMNTYLSDPFFDVEKEEFNVGWLDLKEALSREHATRRMRRRRGGGAEEEKPLALGTSFMKPNLGSALTMATRVVLKTKSGVWEKFDDVLTLSEAISLTHLIEEAYFDVMGKEDEKE